MDTSAGYGHIAFAEMAIEFVSQRLTLGDVVLVDLPGQGEVEATVVREPERTLETVRVALRVAGREDFVKEWALDEMVTVLRGP
jgi:hypothetical protein